MTKPISSLIVVCALCVFPLSVQAKIYDFSISFSGASIDRIGGNVDVTALLEFDSNGNFLGYDDLSFTSGGIERTFAVSGFTTGLGNSGNTTLSSVNLTGGLIYDSVTWDVSMVYSGDDNFRLTADHPDGSFAGATVGQYTLGGSTVNSSTGEPDVEPVAVPEINGGNLALISFVLGTLALFMANVRRREVDGHSAIV